MCQIIDGTFYSEVKHHNKLKEHAFSGKIVNKQLLINLKNNMPYKHFTLEKKNQLAVLLRTKAKKKEIANLLGKGRTTIWREQKRGTGKDGKYYVRKSKRLTREKRLKANSRFKKIENDKHLRECIVKKLKKYWSPEQIAGRWNRSHKKKSIGKDTIYKYIYNQRKDLVKYLRCQKGKYRRRYGTRIREKQREKLKKRRIDERPLEVDLRHKYCSLGGRYHLRKRQTTHLDSYRKKVGINLGR